MSTEPTIESVVILPTCAISLSITPPTDLAAIGGSIAAYSVTITHGVTTTDYDDLEFTVDAKPHDTVTRHFVKQIVELDRGEDYSIVVRAVGPAPDDLETGDSASVAFEATPECSRAAVIRQRIADLIEAADISFMSQDIRVHKNRFGKAISVKNAKPVGDSRPIVEVGVAHVTDENEGESHDTTLMTVSVPVRVLVGGDDPDEAEWCDAIFEKVKDALSADWRLTQFGVISYSWTWDGEAPEESNDGKLRFMRRTLTVPHYYQTGAALF